MFLRRVMKVFFLLFILSLTNMSFSQEINNNVDINKIISEKKFHEGLTRFYLQQYQMAIKIFNEILVLDPTNEQYYYYLGLAYLQAGYVNNAMSIWNSITEYGTDNFRIQQKLQQLYFDITDYSLKDSPYILSDLYSGAKEANHLIYRPSFIYYDKEQSVFYVSNLETKLVTKLDTNMNVVANAGKNFLLPPLFDYPAGIAKKGDDIYIADFLQGKIYRFDHSLIFNEEVDLQKNKEKLYGPMGMAYGKKSQFFYVVDNASDRILKYDKDFNFIQYIGEGILKRPTDIVLSTLEDKVIVSDSGNKRVLVFDPFGNQIKEIKSDAIKDPRGLAFKDNIIYIIDTNTGLYLYNLTTSTLSSLGIDDGKLEKPFDVSVDLQNFLYETDLNSDKIAIFIPLSLRYQNLGLDIKQVLLDQYPLNYLVVQVRDKEGKPIYNLEEENFTLYELGQKIEHISIEPTYQFRDRMVSSFVVDKTVNAKKYDQNVHDILEHFFSQMAGKDLIDMQFFGGTEDILHKQTANVLRPLSFFDDGVYTQDASHLDETLYNSITGLLNHLRNRALILMTSGHLEADSFSTYEVEVIITYAKQNGIPIYVISYTDENKELFKRLTSETFGQYYSLKDEIKIENLYQTIMDAKPLEYVIEYRAANLFGMNDYYVDLRLEVFYHSMIGNTDMGYFPPNIKLKDNEAPQILEKLMTE